MNNINWWSTNFGDQEINLVTESIKNKKVSQGTVTEDFEKKFAGSLGAKYAVAVPSGTVAIYIALMAQGIKCRDEVIIPSYTAVGTAHAAYMLGTIIKFVDIQNNSPTIDFDLIEHSITEKTKAIIPVHYNGVRCNMEKIHEIAKKYKLKIVEDAAQAMYSKNNDKFLGTESSVGCFSLSVAKIISTGQGGLAITNDESIYENMKKIRNQERGVYDIPCFNFKFTDVLSSIGIAQLERVTERIEHQLSIYNLYKHAIDKLDSINFIEVNVEKGEIPLWSLIQSSKRDELENFLNSRNIFPLRFPDPLNKARYFNENGEFPNSSKFAREGLRLPCGPTQPLENVQKVIEALNDFDASR